MTTEITKGNRMRERIHIDLKRGVKDELKQLALEERRSLTTLMNEAVEDFLEKKAKENKKRRKV